MRTVLQFGPVLRFYAALSAEQRRALTSLAGLAHAALPLDQQRLLGEAIQTMVPRSDADWSADDLAQAEVRLVQSTQAATLTVIAGAKKTEAVVRFPSAGL